MEMKQHVGMKMQQQLVMTPRLQMALKILQVSTLELEQFLKNELLQNPLLERLEEGDEPESEEQEESSSEESGDDDSGKESTADSESEQADAGEDERPDDAGDLDWDDYLDDVYSHAYGQNLARDEDDEVERVPVAVATFEDALKNQLHMECAEEDILGIGEYIIDELDSDGYVRDSVSEMAELLRAEPEKVERALEIVQSLDPPGIAARDIEECLLNQLSRKDMGDSLAARVVMEAFDDLKACKHDQIRRRLGVTTDELREAINIISKLNPRPRTDPTLPDPAYITPDLVVEEVDGEYVVYLNDSHIPRVRISPTYRRALADGASGEGRDFISKKLKAARWIVQSIENRRRTMVRVMESIVRAQRGFFEKGVSALRPLTLQQIADDVGMHESTVSRVTRGKYVQTTRGTLELKYFFSSGIKTRDGTEMSSKAVKDAMREIISKEDKHKPLSDQKIAGELKRIGFTISRRAVAKYRDQMNILPARLRKEI
ncbi:MAG: RNA polymerase factor sigma-54 [Candidatus Eisenbacteria bacterium]|nr:RNA polymerase factor sigma-54 [Candidatus Eisenbacteria bacterium]